MSDRIEGRATDAMPEPGPSMSAPAERLWALEEAARLCDGQAELYAAYAKRACSSGGRIEAERALLFERDAETCRELARLIRARLIGTGNE